MKTPEQTDREIDQLFADHAREPMPDEMGIDREIVKRYVRSLAQTTLTEIQSLQEDARTSADRIANIEQDNVRLQHQLGTKQLALQARTDEKVGLRTNLAQADHDKNQLQIELDRVKAEAADHVGTLQVALDDLGSQLDEMKRNEKHRLGNLRSYKKAIQEALDGIE